MKIYILADMEGSSAISRIDEVLPTMPRYEYGVSRMIADINAAVEGAFNGGAKEVVVCDTHGGGGNIKIDDMDERASYECPYSNVLMPSLDASFDGIILLAHHAKAGTQNAFLDHTVSSNSWFEYTLNGKVLGEIGMEAAYAAHFGVPVIMVSGDDKTAAEAKEDIGVECAVVKYSMARESTRCLHPQKAKDIITKHAEYATKNAKKYRPFIQSLPATVGLTFYKTDIADAYDGKQGFRRVDGRKIETTIESLLHVRPF